MATVPVSRHEFVLSRRTDSDEYAVWRFDPDAPELLTALGSTPAGSGPRPSFDRTHQIVQIGAYLLEWGPQTLKAYQPCFPFRLLRFDASAADPLNLPSASVQKGLWTKTKFWAYRPDFGNPQGAHEGFDSGEQLMLLPLGGFVLNVIPTEGRGTYQLWNFDPGSQQPRQGRPPSCGGLDPLPAPYTPQGSFDQIEFGHELLPMNNYVLDRERASGQWALYSFDPQGQPPLALPAVQSGRWTDGDAGIDATHELVPIGDLVLDWTPADRRYRLWRFDPHDPAVLVGAKNGPKGVPLRSGTLPAGFDAQTTLLGIQPPIPVDTARAAQPGTVDFMRSRIKHVVYLMLENRSFDHLLGWLHAKGDAGLRFIGDDRPFDGASTAMFNVDPSTNDRAVHLKQFLDGQPFDGERTSDFLPQDPYHDKSDVLRQCFFTNRQGYSQRAKPDMGGFVWNNGVDQVMWTYTPEQLSVINGLAKSFAVSDEWFCSMPGATDPNRAFAFSGSAMMKLNNWQNGNDYLYWPDYPHRQSIWKVLWSQGIGDWKIYHSVEWMNFVHTYHLYLQGQIPTVDKTPSNWISTIDQFKADARTGNLPAFSFLEPAWIAPVGTTSYHPGADLVPGEQALNEIYEALRGGPHWEQTLFVITFDEHGGIYDHVPPPYARNPWPNDVNDGFAYDMMGVRVPAIVVSPWIDEKTVFRSGQPTPFDHTSILATLLQWFGVPRARWALGDRTDEAPGFEAVLSRKTARTDAPVSFPVPHDASFAAQATPPRISDLQKLMLPRIVAALRPSADAQEATRIADELLATSGDATELHDALQRLARS
ncbi:alkaline phosphatase family protein [Aquabacterium humicola]|uniref:alkaline phosphatase family protein n=1 Tax=Aquabacterium humicola TaxID=3237377 RepID=UPI0025438501|nr:alkaline phosphatase family protein [Rubrivivax pictus]